MGLLVLALEEPEEISETKPLCAHIEINKVALGAPTRDGTDLHTCNVTGIGNGHTVEEEVVGNSKG